MEYLRRLNEDVFLEACDQDDFIGVQTYTRVPIRLGAATVGGCSGWPCAARRVMRLVAPPFIRRSAQDSRGHLPRRHPPDPDGLRVPARGRRRHDPAGRRAAAGQGHHRDGARRGDRRRRRARRVHRPRAARAPPAIAAGHPGPRLHPLERLRQLRVGEGLLDAVRAGRRRPLDTGAHGPAVGALPRGDRPNRAAGLRAPPRTGRGWSGTAAAHTVSGAAGPANVRSISSSIRIVARSRSAR